MKILIPLAFALTLLAGCAKDAPPSLTPAGVVTWQANEAVVAVGTLQRVAIELNGVKVCQPPPDDAKCSPLLSDRNTRTVIDAVAVALNTIKQVPNGWKATALTALEKIRAELAGDDRRKLDPYIEAARTVVNAI